ncbi:MAG: hypothetical protein C0421_01760 [Hyphomonas sp.]|uniref:hypothetical protein n=1 Tax=Hyphomonas sp. TaxID=87 RepID=UPI0025B93352|nr:hypothetical protein [Hyphomonas sp.]MBA4337553.1 hypothetical protein [Hyphomonas sp.]
MKFENYGPFRIPRRGPIIDRPALSGFWKAVGEQSVGLPTAQGCYIFAIKAGKGYTPWYVGKAAGRDGFQQEALSDGKQNQYNWAWSSQAYGKGTMVLFFVARRTASGKDFSRQAGTADIDWLERHLISLALEANNDLLNVHYTRIHKELFVPGVINDPAKKFSEATTELQRTLNVQPIKRRLPKRAPAAPLPMEAIEPASDGAPITVPANKAQSEIAEAPLDAVQADEVRHAALMPQISPARLERAEHERKPRLFLFGRRRS